MKQEQISLKFKKEATLSLWKIQSKDVQKGKNIFLTHGTFSNRKSCLGISEYLVKKGFICWILEWRNHGESAKINEPYNFEIIGKEDIACAFDYLFKEQKIEQVDCITHSGGAISLVINLIEYPESIPKIKKAVFFAGQSSSAGHTVGNRIKLFLGKYMSKLLGGIPAKLLGRPHNEDYSFMKQWFDWNLSNTFKSDTGRNYRLEMPKISFPILSIGGIGDTFVAPIFGCKAFLSNFNNPNNRFLACGISTGYAEDYNHSRLIYSRNAEKEIYPKVLEWLE